MKPHLLLPRNPTLKNGLWGLLCVILTGSLFAAPASAQISVNDVIINFKAGERPVENLIVKNSSPEVFYVTASCDEIVEPSQDQSAIKPTDDVIVSPKRFSIDGENERVVRLLRKKAPDDRERVYRVTFVPQEKNFAEEQQHVEAGRKTKLRVLTGMGLLVFVDPKNAKADLKWERRNDEILFKNDGNLHVRLLEGKACDSEGVGCEELPSRRVYGGRDFIVKVNPKKTVYFNRRDGASGDFKSLVIPPAK